MSIICHLSTFPHIPDFAWISHALPLKKKLNKLSNHRTVYQYVRNTSLQKKCNTPGATPSSRDLLIGWTENLETFSGIYWVHRNQYKCNCKCQYFALTCNGGKANSSFSIFFNVLFKLGSVAKRWWKPSLLRALLTMQDWWHHWPIFGAVYNPLIQVYV